MRRIWAIVILLFSLPAGPAEGQVYNLRLATDNQPDYTDMKSFVESSTGAWQTPQEKAIAVWRWGRRSRRQTSCAMEDGRYILDPILHYNSYGAMNCGIISGLNVSSWLELGFKARYIQLGDHTVSEVSWDDGKSWHLFDSSMSFFCFNHKGEIASCEEIRQAHGCERSGGKVEPGHYYLYHGAPQVASHLGPAGWRFASDQPVGYQRTLVNGADSYTDGFSVDKYCQHSRTGHRYTLNLRPFESYTRYWKAQDDAQHGGEPSANDRDFFRPLANGSDPDDQHGLNNIRGNGVWLFQPDLAAADRDQLFYDSEHLDPATEGSPRLRPKQTGQRASVTYQISTANVITSLSIEASYRRKNASDVLRVLVSRSAGVRWTPVWQAKESGLQTVQINLRDEVAGATQCWIKFEMIAAESPVDVGLDGLKFQAITQVNRRTLPALALGSNQVVLGAGEQVETVELWPPLHAGKYKDTVAEESDLFSDTLPDGIYKATLGAGVNGRPASATWRLQVPTDIVDVAYHTVSTVRGPRHYVSLAHSWDGRQFAEYLRHDRDDFPLDRSVHHLFSGEQVPPGSREAFFRGAFFSPSGAGSYSMAGLQDLLIRVRHKPRRAAMRPLEITYCWTEHRESGDVTRSHTELAASLPHRYTIHTAGWRDPTMNFVRIKFQENSGDAARRYGYSDGNDVGPACEYPKVAYRWGECLSTGKPYTSSRPSSDASGNPDCDGRELTNAVVIAPTDESRTSAVQSATAFWDAGEPVSIVVDVGRAQRVGGVLVASHQPNERYCHPATIEVAVSPDGQSWQSVGTIHHNDLGGPPGDYEPWEHDDDPSYDNLPAGGRLAYRYPLAFAERANARYVRLICTPLAGRGMGLSEIQVFDRVSVERWPEEIKLPEAF